MRRNRTTIDWWLYGLGVCVLLLVAAILLYAADRSRLARDVDELRRELEARPTSEPTGGAEVPIPTFTVSSGWQFPIADSDYLILTSPFGYRVSPLLNIEMHHQGLDIAAAWRAQVVAVAAGTVVEHWPPPDDYWRGHDTYGGMVTIEHADGTRALYAHLSWTRVHTGDRVRAGQVIGRVGNTGDSDGEHLHIEVLASNGERLNPLLYVPAP